MTEPLGPPQLETEPSISSRASTRYRGASPASRLVPSPSLPEAHRTIPIAADASWLRKILAFAGPGYLVAVGYMDPGNWATDLGGAQNSAIRY
jgi:hypothetical protein